MRRQLPFVLLAAIAGLPLAWWWLRDPQLPNDAAHARTPDPVAPARAELATPSRGANEPRREAGAPAPVTDWNATTKGLQLHVRLRGLHANAPWTASLRLALDGRDETRDQWLSFSATCAPDAEGRATFAVPDWCATATQQKGRLEGRDANYQLLDRRWDGPPALAHELVLDVQVVGVFTGRVLDAAGAPVAAARVVAFALRNGEPVEPLLVSTNTREDGSYRLPVPPEAPLWLVAAPMRRSEGRIAATEDGSVPDSGEVRDDLLPAATIATARVGEPTTVPDLVLAPAAHITGSVKWADGEAIARAQIRAAANGAKRLPLDMDSRAPARCSVERDAEGRLSARSVCSTDERGEFVLQAVAGVAYDVGLLAVLPAIQFQPWLAQQAVAPQRVEFRVPRPVVLRAVDGDSPVARASLEIAGQRPLDSLGRTEFQLVVTTALRVRASHGRLRSPWREIGPTDAGTTIDLPLGAALTAVSIEFEGDFRVRNAIVSWRRDDGVEGRENLLRDDRPGAFQVFLEPGRYHLVAGPGGGERNGVFLLPSERDVDLGGGPQTVTMPAIFGGTFTVMATDSSGVYVAGTCELHDRAGSDCTASFRTDNGTTGRPGELLAGGPNSFTRVLPTGDYELMCDFGAHGAHREVVKIKPREATDVRIRLP